MDGIDLKPSNMQRSIYRILVCVFSCCLFLDKFLKHKIDIVVYCHIVGILLEMVLYFDLGSYVQCCTQLLKVLHQIMLYVAQTCSGFTNISTHSLGQCVPS